MRSSPLSDPIYKGALTVPALHSIPRNAGKLYAVLQVSSYFVYIMGGDYRARRAIPISPIKVICHLIEYIYIYI